MRIREVVMKLPLLSYRGQQRVPLATEDYPEYKNKTGVEVPVSLRDV